jgi:predicted nucleotidyltransferase
MNQQPKLDIHDMLTPDGPLVENILAAIPDVLAIYAFGSRVDGTAHDESDLDLAVLVAGYADTVRLWILAGDLAGKVHCDVDLLDMRAASTIMQHQILMTGRRLWARELDADLFECFVLSEKTALDEARAGLLADISERGKIYD